MLEKRKLTTHNGQILALLATTQLMGILDFSIVSIALPTIQRGLHLMPADLQWIVSVYALFFGGFLLVGGRASDLFQRKWVFLLGLGLFTVFSLIGGLASSLLVVLLARAMQGLGAAIFSPAALALVTTTYPEGQERNRALGIFGSVSGLGFTLGVILGGVLTSLFSWRWIFFVNVPLGVLVLLASLLLLPTSAARGQQQLDVAGTILGTSAIAALVMTLSRLSELATSLTPFLVFLVLFLMFTASFIFVEHASQHPLVPLSVFRIRNLLVANLLGALQLAIASIFGFTLTLYLQGVLGLTALVTGLIFIPAGLGGIVGGRLAPQIIGRAGLHSALVTGPALIVLGSALMARITPVDGALWVTLGYMLVGMGLGCGLVTLTIAVTNSLGPEMQGLAAGLLNTSQQIGAALGASLASVVATSVVLALGNHGKAAVTTGDQVAIYLAGALALLSGALAVLAIRPSSTKLTSSEQHPSKIHPALALRLASFFVHIGEKNKA
jgi:EmrB/QacA subfamily drug resistance transporter